LKGQDREFRRDEYQALYSGLIRLHVLHHASEGPIFGLEMIEELSRHGYRIGAGTLYPILHELEAKEWLLSEKELAGGRFRRVYRATRRGRRALAGAKEKVLELFGELFEHENPSKQINARRRSPRQDIKRNA
jgi:PadR family transcriptional regulator PadR